MTFHWSPDGGKAMCGRRVNSSQITHEASLVTCGSCRRGIHFRAAIHPLRLSLESLEKATRRTGRVFREMAWVLRNGHLTDRERLGMALATRHAREGRFDLVAEDYQWMSNERNEG